MKITAKRRFGQHFLRDTGILKRIIHLINPAPGQDVLEIGAGDGVLSVRLAPAVSRLRVIEVDDECIPVLESVLRPFPNVEILKGDVLEIGPSRLLPPGAGRARRTRVVGNLPYNIATAVIERFLDAGSLVEDMIFMVQLEVAQRITAEPCTREYGYLSVMCQHLADVRVHFKVPPQCFVPRPKVMSAVISLRPKECSWPRGRKHAFVDLVKASFSHRRKTLQNSLSFSRIFGDIATEILERCGVSGARRAEELTVQEYEQLSLEVYRSRAGGPQPRGKRTRLGVL